MQRVVINIFDVRTGKIMRDFKGSADDFAVGGTGAVTGVSWPVFRLFTHSLSPCLSLSGFINGLTSFTFSVKLSVIVV